MKVCVTFEKDGYGGEQIERIFSSEEKAQDHIIDTRFDRPMYQNKEYSELKKLALEYISVYEVI